MKNDDEIRLAKNLLNHLEFGISHLIFRFRRIPGSVRGGFWNFGIWDFFVFFSAALFSYESKYFFSI